MRSAFARSTVILLALTFAVLPAGAVQARTEGRTEARIMRIFREFLGLLPGLDKGRAGLDPNGTPAPSESSEGGDTDGRAGLDPNG